MTVKNIICQEHKLSIKTRASVAETLDVSMYLQLFQQNTNSRPIVTEEPDPVLISNRTGQELAEETTQAVETNLELISISSINCE